MRLIAVAVPVPTLDALTYRVPASLPMPSSAPACSSRSATARSPASSSKFPIRATQTADPSPWVFRLRAGPFRLKAEARRGCEAAENASHQSPVATPSEPGTRNPEPGTRNLEPGTRNATRNPEPALETSSKCSTRRRSCRRMS